MKNTTRKGDIAEWEVAAALLQKGMNLLRPISSASRYDLLIEHEDGRFTRVQCKMIRLRRGAITLRLFSMSGHHTRPNPYLDQVDAYGIFCPETGRSYLVPREALGACGRNASIRVFPTKNGQKKRTRSAEEFAIS